MQKRRILINAITSVLQVLVNGVVLFVLYRFLFRTIGVEQLGIWSLVMAITALTRVGDFGLSTSVVKFVAKYVARDEHEIVSGIIQTATITIGLFIGIFVLIAYFLVKWLLVFIIPQNGVATASSILPYAFLSFWIASITGVFQAGLDGHQQIDIRSMILTGFTIFKLFLTFMLVPIYGILGLVYAQVIQAIALAICLWFFLKRHLKVLPILPYYWDRGLFHEMAGYGIKAQIINLSTMTYDPVTKALLTKFGGLAMVGYYEMASRMISQIHSLILTANQVLIPVIAGLMETNKKFIQIVYRDSYRLVFYISVLFFSLIISFIPVISEIWIGRYEAIFIVFSSLLGIAYFLNILSYPAYFSNLGIGELKWNTVGYLLVGVMNAVLGLILGSVFGGMGAVLAWAVSLFLGGLVISVMYHLRHEIPLSELLPKESIGIMLASIIGSLTAILLYYSLRNFYNPFVLASMIILAYFAIMISPAWKHPMRLRLIGWISMLNRESKKG